MTKRDRVVQAIRHKETDNIPYNIDLTTQEYEKVASYFGDKNFMNKVSNHMDGIYYSGNPTEILGKPGYFLDDFGVIWNRNGADKDIGVIEKPVISVPDLVGFSMPLIDEAAFRAKCEACISNGNTSFKAANIGFSLYERAWTLRGMENFLTDMIIEKEFAGKLLDAICDFNIKLINIALEYDFDGIMFGDDWGQQNGLIMGPELWRELIKPRLSKMYGLVKSKNKYVLQHSCGDIHEIFPDVIEIGLDVYQTFQPEIYNIKEIKKEYGNYLTFWGGISTQTLLPVATPNEVKKAIVDIMRVMGKNGGYIAAPTHSVPGDVPPENIEAMIEVFENQDKYL